MTKISRKIKKYDIIIDDREGVTMGKKKILFIAFLTLSVFIPSRVNALCSVTEKTRLQKLATNLAVSYSYTEEFGTFNWGKIKFEVKISNMHNDIYIKDKTNEQLNYYNNNENEIIIKDFPSKTSRILSIVGNTENCMDEKIHELYITTPSYNMFYKDALCETIPKYELCSRWANVTNSYPEFEKKIKLYLKSLEEKEKEKPIENPSFISKLLEFIYKYGLIIVGAVTVPTVIIIYTRKKNEFDLKT